MNRTCLALAALPIAMVAGCSGQGAAPAANADTVAAEVDKIEDAQIAAINGHDLAGAIAVYAPDAVLVAPGEPPRTTAAEIKASMEALLKDKALAAKKTPGKRWVAASGDLVVTTNEFAFTMTDAASGKPVTAPMTAQTSWKKQADGSWKIVADYLVVLPAAPAPQ